MGVRARWYLIAKCDICGREFENDVGGVQCFINRRDALDTVKDCDWVIKDGKLKCYDCIEQP